MSGTCWGKAEVCIRSWEGRGLSFLLLFRVVVKETQQKEMDYRCAVRLCASPSFPHFGTTLLRGLERVHTASDEGDGVAFLSKETAGDGEIS